MPIVFMLFCIFITAAVYRQVTIKSLRLLKVTKHTSVTKMTSKNFSNSMKLQVEKSLHIKLSSRHISQCLELRHLELVHIPTSRQLFMEENGH